MLSHVASLCFNYTASASMSGMQCAISTWARQIWAGRLEHHCSFWVQNLLLFFLSVQNFNLGAHNFDFLARNLHFLNTEFPFLRAEFWRVGVFILIQGKPQMKKIGILFSSLLWLSFLWQFFTLYTKLYFFISILTYFSTALEPLFVPNLAWFMHIIPCLV